MITLAPTQLRRLASDFRYHASVFRRIASALHRERSGVFLNTSDPGFNPARFDARLASISATLRRLAVDVTLDANLAAQTAAAGLQADAGGLLIGTIPSPVPSWTFNNWSLRLLRLGLRGIFGPSDDGLPAYPDPPPAPDGGDWFGSPRKQGSERL